MTQWPGPNSPQYPTTHWQGQPGGPPGGPISIGPDREADGRSPRWAGGGNRGGGGGPRGITWLAWIVIAGICGFIFVQPMVSPDESQTIANPDDPMGLLMMRLQGMYLVGAHEFMTDFSPAQAETLYLEAEPQINSGTVDQRQRFVILAAELAGAEEAAAQLDALEFDIEEQRSGTFDPPFELTQPQERVQSILHELYDLEADPALWSIAANVEKLSADDRAFMRSELEWFGELALAPPDTTDLRARQRALQPAKFVMFTLVGVVVALGCIGLLGLIGLIVLLVMMGLRKAPTNLHASATHHGIYAETFAVWLISFFGLQVAAGIVAAAAALPPVQGLLASMAAFFFSLIALIWPVVRGVPWRQVRADIGWTFGKNPLMQPLVGIAGYAMALPLLGIGLALTLLLMMVQEMFSPQEVGNLFSPMSDPAHPIVLEVAGPDVLAKLVILILAAVAAPIVEETMFRGVLYRHLRDSSRGLGQFVSVLFSGMISSFLFAAIHPQGWVAIPALMGLAWAFVILREWRGSIIPCMIVHGISNALVLSVVILMLTAG